MRKNVIILRGVSGSGKTTFAYRFLPPDTILCCADDFFTNYNGEYSFDASKLSEAHAYCRKKFDRAIENRRFNIAVINTNASEKEFEYYVDTAKKNGYDVFSIVVENRHGNSDIHGVPEEAKERQKQKLINSIKL